MAENAAGAAERHFDVDVVARTVGRPPIVRHGDPGRHNVSAGDTVALRCHVEVKVDDLSNITGLRLLLQAVFKWA